MDTPSLMERTRDLLVKDQRSLLVIYQEIRARGDDQITYYWLRNFKNGYVSDPSVNRVQALYEYLTGRPLLALPWAGATSHADG